MSMAKSSPTPVRTVTVPTVTKTPTPAPREYESATINFEKLVLDAAKAKQRLHARQFRSVSAFVNFHMAEVLGLNPQS